jgi:diguanylate cyclase (GGDEF)-like protein
VPKTAGKFNPIPGAQAGRLRQSTVLLVAALLALVLATTLILTIRNNNKLGAILEESVKSELLAICFAARDDIDMDLFQAINSDADFQANQAKIDATIEKLRDLKNAVGATYIYVLKEIDGSYYFIFDTDEEAGTPDNPIFTEYELAEVHITAFTGEPSADVTNVTDEWGSYNTGAIPLYQDGKVVGIISADVEDTYIERSRQAAAFDTILLIVIISVTMAILLGLLIALLRRNQKMQENLFYVANHDAITGLRNRNYLFSYLSAWSKARHRTGTSFGLLFIDLDNFKRVNDNAGHDEGDRLLRIIAEFFKAHSDTDDDDGEIENLTARIGGDEFVRIIPNITTAEELENRARAMLSAFSTQSELQPFRESFDVGLSIGGALFPSQTTDYSELIRLADIAMYQSKYRGKGAYFLYDEAMGNGPEGIVLSVRTSTRND